jgi:iron complex transport system ATP-binding protein
MDIMMAGPDATKPICLEARNLAFAFGAREVLVDASLSLATGEILSVLGCNGAGKTTLLRLLLGLERPLRGGVFLQARALESFSRRSLAQYLAYLPQFHTPPFPYRVLDVVTLGRVPATGLLRSYTTEDQEIAWANLESLGLSALAERPYTELSGGEKQLVLIARALTQCPRLLIMDEPAASLDYGNQQRLLATLRRLAGSGLGIILSTHHPEHALSASTRVAIVGEGRILADGRPEDVVTPAAIRALYHVDVEIVRGESGALGVVPV